MNYNGNQLAALVRIGIAMATVDGNVADEEQVLIALELAKFGVGSTAATAILAQSQCMDAPTAISTLAALTTEQKKYATGYLAAIMMADGKIEDSEVNMWQLVSTLAGFPTMNIQQAIAFWRNN